MKRIRLADVLWTLGVLAACIAAIAVVFGCSTTSGFLGTGIGAPPPAPPQPEGFQTVHWIAYAGGFLMIVVGAALFWLLQQPRAGGGLAATGFCTIALALGAAYYGKTLALASMLLMGIGIVGGLGYLLWYAFKKKAQVAEIVTKANGHLDGIALRDSTMRSVERVKSKLAKENP